MENIPRIHNIGLLEQIQEFMNEQQCDAEHFKGRIIFMSIFNDIIWDAKGNDESCVNNSKKNSRVCRKISSRSLDWDLDQKKKWYGTYSDKPDGVWDEIAEKMMIEFSETAHPILRASSALERGELRSKGGSKKTVHFNVSEQTSN